MPMIDFYCPEGALDGDARAAALEKMTEALLRCEGAPDNERTRALSWGFIHELSRQAVNVGGRAAPRPVYRQRHRPGGHIAPWSEPTGGPASQAPRPRDHR